MSLSKAPPSIPASEFAERRDAVREEAGNLGYDGILAWSMGGSTLDRYGNVFYLTNHYDPGNVFFDVPPYFTGFGQAAVVIPVDGPAILVVNQPDWRSDLVTCDEVLVSRDLYQGVIDAVRSSGLAAGHLGLVDEERVGTTGYLALRAALPELTLVRADELMLRQRRVKSAAELEMLRHASLVSVEIMSTMLHAAVPGATDGDVAAAGCDVACRRGAQPYDFALASGPQDGHLWWSRLPSWDWQRPYECGDIVHPDIYGAVGGYFYDFVRSLVVGGEPSSAQLELLEGAIGCIQAACAAARAGSTAADVYAAGRGYLHENGLDHVDEGPSAGPNLSTDVLESFGHGIGVGWDEPLITPTSSTILSPGMVLAVEQHVSRRGIGTVRYEDVLVVTEGAPEILTLGCPARWWS